MSFILLKHFYRLTAENTVIFNTESLKMYCPPVAYSSHNLEEEHFLSNNFLH